MPNQATSPTFQGTLDELLLQRAAARALRGGGQQPDPNLGRWIPEGATEVQPTPSSPPAEMDPSNFVTMGSQEPMPPEVFSELRKRFKGMSRKQRKETGGIVEGESGGKKYRYDRWANAEKQGFVPNRERGSFVNFLRFYAQAASGGPAQNLQRLREDRSAKLRAQEMADEQAYRGARLEEDRLSREDANRRAEAGSTDDMVKAAATLYRQTLDGSTADAALADLRNAQRDFYRAQTNSIQSGRGRFGTGQPGARAKPPYTRDQAMNNLSEINANLRSIGAELQSLGDTGFMGLGARFGTDIEFKNAQGQVYRKVGRGDAESVRAELEEEKSILEREAANIKEYLNSGVWPDRNAPIETREKDAAGYALGGMPPSALWPEDPMFRPEDAMAEGDYNPADDVPAAGEDEAAGGVTSPDAAPTGTPAKAMPPSHILAKLPYRDQLYYQIQQEQPGASHEELIRMVASILNSKQAPAAPRMAFPGKM